MRCDALLDRRFDPMDLRELCREKFNLALGNGLGKIEAESFRIGHMGDLNEGMIFGTLGIIETALKTLGIPYEAGAVNAAIDALTKDNV